MLDEYQDPAEDSNKERALKSGPLPCNVLVRPKPTYEELEKRVQELEKECSELRKIQTQQKELEKRLSDALTKILSGYLPICAKCKRIRSEEGEWSQIETYIQAHTEAIFSHSLCPKCAKSFYPEFLEPEENL